MGLELIVGRFADFYSLKPMALSSSIFKKNIKALKAHRPKIAKLVAHPVGANHLRIERTPNGAARLLVTTDAGAEVSLHDPVDPLWVAQGTAEQMAPTLQGVTVLLGMELGYLTKALALRLPQGARLVVYEADPAIFLAALRETDLVEPLSSLSVQFVIGPSAVLDDVCSQAIVDTNGPLKVVSYEPAIQIAPEAYGKKAQARLTALPAIIAATRHAIGERGPLYLNSIFESIPHIMSTPGIHGLKDVCLNRSAVLVAAGPSLEKNVRHLKQAQGRAVIIAADTALGYLLARDIQPDFVVSADPQDETYRKFEGLDIPEQVALVFHPAANHQIIKHFPGPKFTMDTTIPAYQWLQGCWRPKGALEQETMCQVHLGFNLAEWMGCTTIILVGQDLCFSEAGMHVKGGSYLKADEEHMVLQQSQNAFDVFGKPVRTTPTFLNYKVILERKIARFPGLVVNATEGGLKIEGADMCPLSDALAAHGDAQETMVYPLIQAMAGPERHSDWEGLLQEVRRRSRDLFRVARTSGHVCRLLQRMAAKRQTSDGVDAEMRRLGAHVQRLTGLIARYTQVRPLLHWMDISLERKLKEESRLVAEIKDAGTRHDKQIAQGLHYYGGLARLAPVLRNQLRRLHDRLARHWLLERSHELQVDSLSDIQQAGIFYDIERFDLAAHCLHRWMHRCGSEPKDSREAWLFLAIPLALHHIHVAYERSRIIQERWMADPDIAELVSRIDGQWQAWHKTFTAGHVNEIDSPPSHVQDGAFTRVNLQQVEDLSPV